MALSNKQAMALLEKYLEDLVDEYNLFLRDGNAPSNKFEETMAVYKTALRIMREYENTSAQLEKLARTSSEIRFLL